VDHARLARGNGRPLEVYRFSMIDPENSFTLFRITL